MTTNPRIPSRRFAPFALLLALALTGLAAPLAVRAAEYRADYATHDGGGALAISPRYSHAGSLGGLGGTPSASSHASLRPGFLGQLNDPPNPGADLLHRPAQLSTKTTLATLTANDTDPEGGPLMITAIDARSAAGGSISVEGDWILFEPDASQSPSDAFHYVVSDAEGDLALVRVEVSTQPPNLLQTRNLLAITPLAGGVLRLDFIGIPARRYRIEWTATLNPPVWESLGSIEAGPEGLFSLTDHPEGDARFYRAVAE